MCVCVGGGGGGGGGVKTECLLELHKGGCAMHDMGERGGEELMSQWR